MMYRHLPVELVCGLAKVSHKSFEKFGEDSANELADWFNSAGSAPRNRSAQSVIAAASGASKFPTMPPLPTYLVVAAMLGLVALFVFWYRRTGNRRALVLQLGALIALAVFLHVVFDFPRPREVLTARGEADSTPLIVFLLFAAMLLGMLAHWLYGWLETPHALRKPFYLGL